MKIGSRTALYLTESRLERLQTVLSHLKETGLVEPDATLENNFTAVIDYCLNQTLRKLND